MTPCLRKILSAVQDAFECRIEILPDYPGAFNKFIAETELVSWLCVSRFGDLLHRKLVLLEQLYFLLLERQHLRCALGILGIIGGSLLGELLHFLQGLQLDGVKLVFLLLLLPDALGNRDQPKIGEMLGSVLREGDFARLLGLPDFDLVLGIVPLNFELFVGGALHLPYAFGDAPRRLRGCAVFLLLLLGNTEDVVHFRIFPKIVPLLCKPLVKVFKIDQLFVSRGDIGIVILGLLDLLGPQLVASGALRAPDLIDRIVKAGDRSFQGRDLRLSIVNALERIGQYWAGRRPLCDRRCPGGHFFLLTLYKLRQVFYLLLGCINLRIDRADEGFSGTERI